MNKRLQFLFDNKPIKWDDITKTYELDKQSSTTRTLLKITNVHIAPSNFQKMRVKYAAQIFSNTLGAAIKTAADTKTLYSPTAKTTGDFLQRINKIFDALNSTRLIYWKKR